MKRIMIDTNVYEFFLKYIERNILEKILLQKNIIFYGNSIIRRELREIPKTKKEIIDGHLKGLRNALLNIYDLMIVACASLNKLDILVSEDTKTMLSEVAIKSYESVNKLFGFKTPSFIKFNEFRNRLRGGKLD